MATRSDPANIPPMSNETENKFPISTTGTIPEYGPEGTPRKHGNAGKPPVAVTEPPKRRKVNHEDFSVDCEEDNMPKLPIKMTTVDVEEDEHEQMINEIAQSIRELLEGLTQAASQAFLAYEKVSRDLLLAKEELEAKTIENQRLVANENANRTTLAKLIQEATLAKEQSRELMRITGELGSLRGEHALLLHKSNDQVAEVEAYKRKSILLKEELSKTAQLYSQVREDYSKLQRDHRQVMAFQEKENKRREQEDEIAKMTQSKLQVQIQSLKATLEEKDRELADTRTELERLQQKRDSIHCSSTPN